MMRKKKKNKNNKKRRKWEEEKEKKKSKKKKTKKRAIHASHGVGSHAPISPCKTKRRKAFYVSFRWHPALPPPRISEVCNNVGLFQDYLSYLRPTS